MKKIKFFLIGLIPGLAIVFFILNKKGASCSGYLPNSRVIAETLSKDFVYSDSFKNEMTAHNVTDKFLRDSILTEGNVDFDRSHAQKKPCPDYVITYPSKKAKYEIAFEKCAEKVNFTSLKKLK
ncbi:hypothetical protein ASG01_11095 [Chryseobacterium sp. Leaf180]|uniref:hypothetical protein n=1 Tax=Chryseobacterium sp. Leaf180 TaxID=1736289 RepID=UPI0006F9F21F|nr:hypothetical protein [Chryseobacterium sp. Leaf180]KQR92459.1 hypothetical protein ASG01_11095 [Chryseobacterium sp. Leaf180]